MAREIFIHNSRFLKQRLSIEDFIGDDNYEVSYLDQNMRLTTEKSEACFTMIYDRDHIGRGVQIVNIEDKHTIHLAVNIPCTAEDVTMLYKVSLRLAQKWNAKYIMVDDYKVDISDIEQWIDHDISMNINILKDSQSIFQSESTKLFCALLPISILTSQLQEFANDYKSYSEYLNIRQQIDAFYSCPIFFERDSELYSLYVGISEGTFIIPKCPEMTFVSNGVNKECSKALIAVSEVFPDEGTSMIDYQTFINRIPEEKVSDFDCQHFLVSPLSIKELKSIFRR